MAALESLYERVWDEMPSVTESYALRALADSVKEFCARTHIWQKVVDLLPSVDGYRYVIDAPAGTVVTAVKSVRHGDCWLNAQTTFARALWQSPRSYWQDTPSVLVFDAAPADPLVVVAALTLALGRTDVEFPDDVADEYGEAIAAGAKMRLCKMQNQDWSNPPAATGYGVIYYNAITTAKRRLASSMDQADLRVEMRAWV